MVHYSRHFKLPQLSEPKASNHSLVETDVVASFNDSSTLKTLVFPVSKDQVLVRVSNLEDSFDKSPEAK